MHRRFRLATLSAHRNREERERFSQITFRPHAERA